MYANGIIIISTKLPTYIIGAGACGGRHDEAVALALSAKWVFPVISGLVFLYYFTDAEKVMHRCTLCSQIASQNAWRPATLHRSPLWELIEFPRLPTATTIALALQASSAFRRRSKTSSHKPTLLPVIETQTLDHRNSLSQICVHCLTQ